MKNVITGAFLINEYTVKMTNRIANSTKRETCGICYKFDIHSLLKMTLIKETEQSFEGPSFFNAFPLGGDC